jgi:hypothetical protein
MDGKLDRYIDRIVDFLIDDTEYNISVTRFQVGVAGVMDNVYEVGASIWFPSDPDSGYSYRKYDIKNWMDHSMYIVEDMDYVYIKNTYGISNLDVIQEIYNRFIKKLCTKIYYEMVEVDDNNINESVNNKRESYLNKILNYLVEDTEIGYGWFNPPYYLGGGKSTAGRTGFKSVYLHTFGLLKDTAYSGLESQLIYFKYYCIDNYGLTEDEIDWVWKEYMKKINEIGFGY